jgi:2-dehydropantoate 2-reductase
VSTRYIIIGAGAVGSHLAAQLTLAEIPAVLVARGAQLEALRNGPLTVHRLESSDEVRLDVVGGPDELTLTADDILVLATKTQDAEAALNDWAWVPVEGATGVEPGQLAADLPLVTLQNGIASEEIALRRFARTISVGTMVPVSYLEPGQAVSLTAPKAGFFQVGALPHRLDDDSELVDQLVADFEAAGYVAKRYDDIVLTKQLKLLHNILNGVDVLDGTPEEKAELSRALVQEAQEVYREAGIASEFPEGLDVDLAAAFGNGAFNHPRAPRRSTWQSFARGVSSEVDYLNGEVVLIARRHDAAAPLNERLQRVLGASHRLGEPPQTRHVSDVLSPVSVNGR